MALCREYLKLFRLLDVTPHASLPLPSRLHHPHVTNQDTTMIYACAILGQSITMPLVGLLQFSLGLRGCAAFGACLVGFATLASALATSVTGLSVLNGAFGVGIAFA